MEDILKAVLGWLRFLISSFIEEGINKKWPYKKFKYYYLLVFSILLLLVIKIAYVTR